MDSSVSKQREQKCFVWFLTVMMCDEATSGFFKRRYPGDSTERGNKANYGGE